MNNQPFIFSLFALLFVIQGCKRSFNKPDWVSKQDMEYPERNAVVDDLVSSHKLAGLNYKQVIELLGEPDGQDTPEISYDIKLDYGWDIDPVYSKYLNISFSKDSVVNDVAVKEWRKP